MLKLLALIVLATVIALACFFRYSLYPVPGTSLPATYRLDRWTGKTELFVLDREVKTTPSQQKESLKPDLTIERIDIFDKVEKEK